MAESPSEGWIQVDGEVREGLLCPICLFDLKTVNQLREHFDVVHSSEDHDVFHSLKGFIDKAKRKLLKQDVWCEEQNRTFEDYSAGFSNLSLETYELESPQETGTITRHTDTFKKLRENKIDRYVIETNKLLIRLDKLISDAPDDPEKRKAHEKSIVPWIPDSDVRLCPGCARSFGLSRRRHHCRLCGGIMCHVCSQFIDFTFARKLTHPTVNDDLVVAIPRPLQRRGSNSSLLSVVNMSGEPHIRICKDCRVLLLRRDEQVEQRTIKPIIVQMYERMKDYMTEVEKLAPLYNKMVESLSSGETVYHLQDAQDVRIKMTRMTEGIDLISKKIANLGNDDQTCARTLQLQSGVRLAATQFLRNTILGLPSLPTPEEVSHYQNARKEMVQRRIEQEKQAAVQSCGRTDPSQSPSSDLRPSHLSPKEETKKQQISLESGWSVSPVKPAHEDDPMLQQINIIHKYIKQARLDHKYDEVHMLENNLRELQQEYLKQQHMSPT